MSAEYIKIILDVVIICGLGAFIFYAIKLSRALSAFRSHRNQFDTTMQELSNNIQQAQSSLTNLKETSQQTSEGLSKLVLEGKELRDELQLINEAGNNLATRLETLAAESRQISQEARQNVQSKHTPQSMQANDDFMIQDQEFDEMIGDDLIDEDDGDVDGLSSAAEKELFRALKRNKG